MRCSLCLLAWRLEILAQTTRPSARSDTRSVSTKAWLLMLAEAQGRRLERSRATLSAIPIKTLVSISCANLAPPLRIRSLDNPSPHALTRRYASRSLSIFPKDRPSVLYLRVHLASQPVSRPNLSQAWTEWATRKMLMSTNRMMVATNMPDWIAKSSTVTNPGQILYASEAASILASRPMAPTLPSLIRRRLKRSLLFSVHSSKETHCIRDTISASGTETVPARSST